MKSKIFGALLAIALIGSLGACTQSQKTIAGAAIGAGTGGLIGDAIGGGTGAIIGGVGGAVAGGYIGNKAN
jgi:uncharacterized protein YcfJ